jgi:hypothetical protein
MLSTFVLLLTIGVHAPAQATLDYASYYAQGITFAEFLTNARALADEWHGVYTHATIEDSAVTRARALKGRWQLLIVADDSCHDSVNTVPYLAKLSEAAADTLSIRIVPSAVGQAVKDAHQTPDGRPATPTVVVLDQRGVMKGVFIERPAALRQYVEEHGAGKYPHEVREMRRQWYQDDRGRHAISEILDIMEGS